MQSIRLELGKNNIEELGLRILHGEPLLHVEFHHNISGQLIPKLLFWLSDQNAWTQWALQTSDLRTIKPGFTGP